MKTIKTPTGKIVIMDCEKGPLEFVSLGDYGKQANIKADFLGLTDEINGVENSGIMPLTEKWVITISTQYGCSMNCTFCDVPKVGPGINATYHDMLDQIKMALSLEPEIDCTKRLNIHFARMGEPTFNGNVLDLALCLKRNIYDFYGNSGTVHPVISTMMPKNNRNLLKFLNIWTGDIKNNYYNGEAGLQFSINSTSDAQRNQMFSGNSLDLDDISNIGIMLPDPVGRKYTLNFALHDDFEVDAKLLCYYFDPNKFLVKLTPIHNTATSIDNKIVTTGGYDNYYPYKKVETDLKNVGFDVIVFIPSKDEEESRITCGNAILADSK